MTSESSHKSFLEQNLNAHFSGTKNRIKPLISTSLHQHLNEEKLKKKLALHSTLGKNFAFAPQPSSKYFRQSIKHSAKLVRNQHYLSRLQYKEEKHTYFNDNLFYSKLKNLPVLSSLQLSLCGSYQDTLKSITPLLANLSSYKRLTHLDLRFLHFDASDIKLLCHLLRGIQALKPTLKSFSIMIVQGRNMKDLDLRVISLYLRKFTQLEALTLTLYNSPTFNDEEFLNLAAALSKLKSLRKIDLNFGNSLIGQAIPKFFTTLQRLQNLSDFSLNFSKCDPDQEVNTTTESIVAGLALLKTHPTQKLVLDFGTLYHSSADLSLSRILPQFTLLKSLSLYFVSKNQGQVPLKDQDFVDVLACLKEIPHLSSLLLSFPSLTQLSAIVGNVGETLKSLSGLAQLKLNFTGLNCTDEDMMSLCSGLECLPSLKSLEINLGWVKQTTMKGINVLIEALKKMVRVRNLTLDLSGNNFITNEGFLDLCSSIQCLQDLTFLDLNLSFGRSLNFKDVEELAKTLSSLGSLETFRLNCRELSRLGRIFQTLFEVLKEKQTIQDVSLTFGENLLGRDTHEVLKFKQTKNFSLSERS